MSSASALAAGFTISGILDEGARTRKRFPVSELPVADIQDHPNNVVYSMDEASIEKLAASTKQDGLTDLPLVRKLDAGGYQMISGHRRKAAYSLLAESDGAYAKMPCRIIEGITEAQAVTLLHTANYFVRELTVTERAAATRALGVEIERMREEDESLAGMRTRDIKAAIITEQTGRLVSGKSIERQEAIADLIENNLASGWRSAADAGKLSNEAVKTLAKLPERDQQLLHVKWSELRLGKRDTTDFIRRSTSDEGVADERLRRAVGQMVKYLTIHPEPVPSVDKDLIETLFRHAEKLREIA